MIIPKKKQGNRNEKIQELKPIPQKVGQVIRQDKNKYIDFKQIKDSTKAKLIELKKYNIDTTQFLCFKGTEIRTVLGTNNPIQQSKHYAQPGALTGICSPVANMLSKTAWLINR